MGQADESIDQICHVVVEAGPDRFGLSDSGRLLCVAHRLLLSSAPCHVAAADPEPRVETSPAGQPGKEVPAAVDLRLSFGVPAGATGMVVSADDVTPAQHTCQSSEPVEDDQSPDAVPTQQSDRRSQVAARVDRERSVVHQLPSRPVVDPLAPGAFRRTIQVHVGHNSQYRVVVVDDGYRGNAVVDDHPLDLANRRPRSHADRISGHDVGDGTYSRHERQGARDDGVIGESMVLRRADPGHLRSVVIDRPSGDSYPMSTGRAAATIGGGG